MGRPSGSRCALRPSVTPVASVVCVVQQQYLGQHSMWTTSNPRACTQSWCLTQTIFKCCVLTATSVRGTEAKTISETKNHHGRQNDETRVVEQTEGQWNYKIRSSGMPLR